MKPFYLIKQSSYIWQQPCSDYQVAEWWQVRWHDSDVQVRLRWNLVPAYWVCMTYTVRSNSIQNTSFREFKMFMLWKLSIQHYANLWGSELCSYFRLQYITARHSWHCIRCLHASVAQPGPVKYRLIGKDQKMWQWTFTFESLQKSKVVHSEPHIYCIYPGNCKRSKAKKIFVRVPLFRNNCV